MTQSEYKDRVIFVGTDAIDIETFADEALGNVEDYTEDLILAFNHSLVTNFNMSEDRLNKIIQGKYSTINIKDVYRRLSGFFTDGNSATTGDDLMSVSDCLYYLETGDTCGYSEKAILGSLYEYGRFTLTPYSMHPSQAGHTAKYECLRDAYEAGLTCSEVADQRNEQTKEAVHTAISDSLSNLALDLKNQMSNNFTSIMNGNFISLSDMFNNAYNAMVSNFNICVDNVLNVFGL